MRDRSKKVLFFSRYFSAWKNTVLVVGAFPMFTIGMSTGGEVLCTTPLYVNDPVSSYTHNSDTSKTVYPLSNFELPADNGGKIDTILLRNRHKRDIAHIVKATSPHVKIAVFVKREEIGGFRASLISYLREENISPERIDKVSLLPLDSKQPYWMRDNGILFVNRKLNLITFVECVSQNGDGVNLDEYIRSSPSDNIVFNDSAVTFNFPGGEIVVSNSYVFCKRKRLFGNGNLFQERQKFELLCKKRLIDFDMIETPTTHIDLWLTPIDDKTVLLGDLSLGREIMERIPKSGRSRIVKRFLKAETADGYIRKRGEKDCNKFFYKMIFKNRNNSSECNSSKAVKGYLEERGFTVIPIPSIGHLDIHPDSYYSYNNVLMESYVETNGRIVKNVVLPEYGHPLDEKARQVWESQGFAVKQFPMNNIARKGGAIRCSSQRVPGTVCYNQARK